jgi:hypothetical protein
VTRQVGAGSSRRADLLIWARRAAIAVAITTIVIQWANTRTASLLANQNPAHPLILATYPIYHAMATGIREGRIGKVDLAGLRRYSSLNDLSAVYERLPQDASHEWVNYYTLDIGYSFIVEAARLAFPGLPDNHLRAIALQLVADAALIAFVFYIFSQWGLCLGLVAAFLYASQNAFGMLASFAYYYYWDIPLAFGVLGSIMLAFRRPESATLWLTIAGLVLGCGAWLRGSWWPLSLFLLGVTVMSPALRRKVLVPITAFALIAAPQVIRSSVARGRPTLSTRAVWHVAMVGLGYYPNRYGLALHDEVVFKLTRDKYGVKIQAEDYEAHDQAARKEFLSIWEKDRGFVLRSFWGRLSASVVGATESSVPSFLFFPNLSYRIACFAGFVAMILRGGDKRLLALASAGMYVIYVGLTSAFFYVGLAYSNVSEVTLFVLFVGGIEAGFYATQRWLDCDDEWRSGWSVT